MSKLNEGQTIKTNFGAPIKIGQYIAGGGQGDVYHVEYNGQQKALKWYKKNALKKPRAFYENLKSNTQKGAPDDAFLWPQAVTEVINGQFGYLMDLRPSNFIEFTELLTSNDHGFRSFKDATEACIKIVKAFRILHNNGYSYQDMNSGNFFINPSNGDVLICDNDNVAQNGMNTGIVGTPQYMAPEIVLGKSKPNIHTDEFSLAVVLFMILCANHPLEGMHWSKCPCLTPDHESKLYGSKALFIFDPKDKSNAPDRSCHINVIQRWEYMPDYLKKIFTEAFSQSAIKEPNRRIKENDWLKALVRFRSDIVSCPKCNNEIFINNAKSTKCDCCNSLYNVNNTFKLNEYSVTAAKGTRIYKCQITICNADNALNPVGLVVAKRGNPNVLGLRNMTKDIMICSTPSGKEKRVSPREIIPVKKGICIKIFDGQIEIK